MRVRMSSARRGLLKPAAFSGTANSGFPELPQARQPQQVGAGSVSGETEPASALSSRFRRAAAAVLLLLAAPALAGDGRTEPAVSNSPPPTPQAKSKPKAAPAVPAAPPPAQQPALPGVDGILYLIRSTLLTLNDANHSGNYTVLRDLAAPDFQARYTTADLAAIFTDLRRRNFDLFAVALVAPQLTASPALDANKLLRLTGLFPTRPLQINFELVFEVVNDRWRLDGISVATPEAPPQPQASQQPGSAPSPAAKKPAPKPQ
jgi:hypothetical protein